MIRVVLPAHLQALAKTKREVQLVVEVPVTLKGVLDVLEKEYPMLRGTIRDQQSGQRRPLVRFFANGSDLSHETLEAPLPKNVAQGAEPLLIVGAIAGG